MASQQLRTRQWVLTQEWHGTVGGRESTQGDRGYAPRATCLQLLAKEAQERDDQILDDEGDEVDEPEGQPGERVGWGEERAVSQAQLRGAGHPVSGSAWPA